MSAYIKLVHSVLSADCYTVAARMHCVSLLVLACQLFNAHLCVADARVLSVANSVYGWALRRIAGER